MARPNKFYVSGPMHGEAGLKPALQAYFDYIGPSKMRGDVPEMVKFQTGLGVKWQFPWTLGDNSTHQIPPGSEIE